MNTLFERVLRELERKFFTQRWEMHNDQACSICFEEFSGDKMVLQDGPLNSDIPTDCCHWLCSHCWDQIYDNGYLRCPICLEDVSEWLMDRCEYDSDSE